MVVLYFVIAFLVVFMVIFLGVDFTKFVAGKFKETEKNGTEGVKCESGGILFNQGGKTYYQMPKGTRRKIADFPMDLTPGSKDMNEFTRIMDQAAKECINEDRQKRMKAKENMIEVSRETFSKGAK